MGTDFFDDLHKQSLAQLASSYLWPSTAFWTGNFIAYSLLYNYSIDLNLLSQLSGELIVILFSFFTGLIVFTAWLMMLVVPFVYMLLQLGFLNRGWLRSWQVEKFTKLNKADYELGTNQEKWLSRLDRLQNLDHRGNVQMSFEIFRTKLRGLVERRITKNFLLDDSFYSELSQLVEIFESNRNEWSMSEDYSESQILLTGFYKTILDKIDAELSRITKQRSNILEELSYRFPQNIEWILPSRFGNCWAAIESYTLINYDVALPLLWSRLLAFIPKEYYELVVSSKARIDAAVSGLSLIFLFGLVWFYPVVQNYPVLMVLSFVVVILMMIWLTYMMGLNAVIAYGKLTRSAVDLFRCEVISHMGFALPDDLESEKAIWRDIQSVWTASSKKNLEFNRVNKVENE